jgi:AAA15 family ATPase/GTPase
MSQNLIHELDFEIDKLRNLYKAISSTLQKYLSELNNEVIMMTTYQDFLNNFYKYFKDYVNEGLIPWVYANVFHEPVRLNNYDYDSGYYLQLMYAQLELKLMKKMKQYIKRITKELPDDQVFNLLLASYDQEIIEREKNIKILKSQSFL